MPAIKYTFIADGVPTVVDGFKSIGDEARSSSKAIEQGMRSIRTSSREVTRESGRAMTAQEKFAKDLAAAAKKAEIEDRKRAAEEAKAMRAYAREQERVQKHVAGIRDRYFAEQQKAGERSEAQKRKEIAKDISAKRAHEEKLRDISQKAKDKDHENERKHADRMAAIKRESAKKEEEHRAKLRAGRTDREQQAYDNKIADRNIRFQKEFKDRQKKLEEKNSLSKGVGAAVRGAFIGTSAAVVASTLGIAGSAARQSLALHEVANRVSINSREAGEDAVDPRLLRKEFEQTAARTPGVAAIDIGNAVQQFVTKTGNLDVARKSQGVFATVASATGSNISDVSEAAADLFQKFDIKKMEDMADAMAALAFQGKNGSFELKDAAGQFARLSSAASRFGLGKGVESVKVLGGLTQIAREGTGSPEQAATAIEALFRQFTDPSAVKKLGKLSGGGVNPFLDKGHTKTKDIRSLIVETITKAGGDQIKLQDIFNTEGIRGISQVIAKFNEAKQAASVGGASKKDSNEAGAQAARDYLTKMIDAPGDFKELQKDAAQAQQDASAKLSNAWEKIVAGISDAAIPAISKLVESIENSPGAIEALIGTTENLLFVFGALIEATQDLMEWMGIATKKTKSPEQRQEEAKKKVESLEGQLKRFDQKRGGSREQVLQLLEESSALEKSGDKKGAQQKLLQANAMKLKLDSTKEMDDERNTIAGKLAAAKKEAEVADTKVKTVQDQQNRIRSSDAFASEYAAMLEPEKNKGQNMLRAKEIAQQLRDHSITDASTTTGQDLLPGETEAARDFRVRQATARRDSAQLANYGKENSSENLQAAMARVESAAKAMESAATAIKSANQTSIVPQP